MDSLKMQVETGFATVALSPLSEEPTEQAGFLQPGVGNQPPRRGGDAPDDN
ncbi:MAG: hypothetical protein IH586_07435 [Anaerolineaceae bacterium]|nr:hypothetical protein [Anaerolineaceae bacterium]